MSGEAIPMGAITSEPRSSAAAVDLTDVNLENGDGGDMNNGTTRIAQRSQDLSFLSDKKS